MKKLLKFLFWLMFWTAIVFKLSTIAPLRQAIKESYQNISANLSLLTNQQFAQRSTITSSGRQNWWLTGNDQVLTYRVLDNKLAPSALSAASWWNQVAGKTVVVPASSEAKPDVYITSFTLKNEKTQVSGLTTNYHMMLINTDQANDTIMDNTVIHEMGHALGVGHSDQLNNEVMSPSQASNAPLAIAQPYDKKMLTRAMKNWKKSSESAGTNDVLYQQLSQMANYPDADTLKNKNYGRSIIVESLLVSAAQQDEHSDKLSESERKQLAQYSKEYGNNQNQVVLSDAQLDELETFLAKIDQKTESHSALTDIFG